MNCCLPSTEETVSRRAGPGSCPDAAENEGGFRAGTQLASKNVMGKEYTVFPVDQMWALPSEQTVGNPLKLLQDLGEEDL